MKKKLISFYDKRYKELLLATLAIFLLSLLFLGYKQLTTGEIINRGISLRGGVEVTFSPSEQVDVASLTELLRNELNSKDLFVRSTTELGVQKEIIIESSAVTVESILDALRKNNFKITEGSYTSQQIGSKLGEKFFYQMFLALLFALLGISLVVYITFREIVPSLFVILAAVSDLVTVLAVLSFFNITLSIAGVAAFLMMLGYSVDTDILLTTRVVKTKEGKVRKRIFDAMRTGLTMSLTSIVAIVLAFFITQSATIKEIMLILSLGLFIDVYNTWIQNAGILRWYMERKYGKD